MHYIPAPGDRTPLRARMSAACCDTRVAEGTAPFRLARWHGDAKRSLELGNGIGFVDDLDGRHAEGPRRLEIAAQIVEEHGLRGADPDALACHLIEPRVRFAHTFPARLDDGVEQIR